MKIHKLFSYLFILFSIPTYAVTLDTLPGAIYGYIVTDLSSGNTVISKNADRAFIPASTIKCITAAAAISTHGSDYRFKTDIYSIGNKIDGDTLQGNLLIAPHGDPSLDITLCNTITSTGIKSITGSIVIPATEPYVNPSVMLEDVGSEYGVGWSTFNYNNNIALTNDSMKTEPLSNIINEFIIDLKQQDVTANNLPIDHLADTTLITTHYSARLIDLCKHMMYESDNLYAQAIGRSLSDNLILSAALDSMNAFMAARGIKNDHVKLADMSGLARTNLITPRSMARLLASMVGNKDYVSCFAKNGHDGTVKRFLNKTRLDGKFRLKTGSMSGILAYAGYKIDHTGRPTHTVVIMINNYLGKQSVVKHCIEQWFLKTF